MFKISGYKWYGVLWVCYNFVVIISFSIYIIVGLLLLLVFFISYMLLFCLDYFVDILFWNVFIFWFGGEVL